MRTFAIGILAAAANAAVVAQTRIEFMQWLV
jgi:C1A family cysteine protease